MSNRSNSLLVTGTSTPIAVFAAVVGTVAAVATEATEVALELVVAVAELAVVADGTIPRAVIPYGTRVDHCTCHPLRITGVVGSKANKTLSSSSP